MTVQQGRDAYTASRTLRLKRPTDPAAVRRSAVERGRAMFAASRGDRAARAAVDFALADEADTAPPTKES